MHDIYTISQTLAFNKLPIRNGAIHCALDIRVKYVI